MICTGVPQSTSSILCLSKANECSISSSCPPLVSATCLALSLSNLFLSLWWQVLHQYFFLGFSLFGHCHTMSPNLPQLKLVKFFVSLIWESGFTRLFIVLMIESSLALALVCLVSSKLCKAALNSLNV